MFWSLGYDTNTLDPIYHLYQTLVVINKQDKLFLAHILFIFTCLQNSSLMIRTRFYGYCSSLEVVKLQGSLKSCFVTY